MKKFLFYTFLFLIVHQEVLGQNFNNYQHKGNSFFPTTERYKPWGWFVSPGATTMLTKPGNTQKQFDTTTYNFDPAGQWALYIDLGLYKLFKYPGFFRSMDFGIAYKGLRGKEEYYAPFIEGDGSFSDQYGSAFFNLNNVYEIGNPWFIVNSFGINADYRFANSIESSSGQKESFPSQIEANIHYKFSIGFMATKSLLVMPSIETPLVGFLSNMPWSYQNYFNSSYQPLILSIKFLFLGKAKDVCPPVYAPGMMDGMTPDGMSK